jgi:hypothetical protein
VFPELVRAFPAAVVAGVLPGWFWARALCPATDPAERLVYSVALSLTLVPACALLQARLFSSGVTLPIAVVSVLVVFVAGLGAYLRFGVAKGPEDPLASPPTPPGIPTLVPFAAASVVALLSMVGVLAGWRGAPLVALLVLLGGVAHLLTRLPRADAPPGSGAARRDENVRSSGARIPPAVLWVALPAVFCLILARAYVGPLRYDWPFPRGVDRFEHAVMADMMLSQGTTDSFMLYPPGLHVLAALLSRLSGLEPLDLFAILAPALLLLPALACYAVARRLWGPEVGVAAALFCGLVTNGPYEHVSHARYANIIAAQFLLVLALGALLRLYASASRRDGLTLAILGSSVVLYHQVASLYEATLLALVAALFVPFLLVRDREKGLALVSSLALLGFLSALYAWDTYDLGRLAAGLLGGTEAGKGGEAVGMALGTKPPFPPEHLLVTATQPALWLGLLGALLLLVDGGRGDPPDATADVLARSTLLFWSSIMFVGSQTALSSFPDRFERDLGVPLALLAALASVAVLRSVTEARGPTAGAAALAAVLPVAVMVAYGAMHNLEEADGPAERDEDRAPPPQVVAAGEWLGEHNEGGRILPTPYFGPTSARGMLAMGGYSGMQAYTEKRIEKARDLPPFGAEPLRDVLWVVNHPEGERTRRVLRENDVRYVVLNKRFPGAGWLAFEEREKLYRPVFENETVIIFEPRRTG